MKGFPNLDRMPKKRHLFALCFQLYKMRKLRKAMEV
jgi:hypothetical protein